VQYAHFDGKSLRSTGEFYISAGVGDSLRAGFKQKNFDEKFGPAMPGGT
jgi:hypothetical protein